jgi:hypothetical protein
VSRRLGALVLSALPIAALMWAPARAQILVPKPPEVFVFLVPGTSFEDLLGVREVAALARSGGAALMRLEGGLPTRGEPGVAPGEGRVAWRWLSPAQRGGLPAVGQEIRREVSASSAEEVLVFVGSTVSSPQMVAEGDEVHPLVMASGAPATLFPTTGGQGSLTSDSTHRDGVVVDLDVVPTIAAFLGEPAPADATGSPIRVVEGPPPYELHERYLAQRRMYVPIGTGAALYVTAAGLFGTAALALRRRVPASARRFVGWWCLSVPALATGLLAAGHLPQLSYAAVVPFVAIVAVLGTMAFSPLERRSLVLVPAGIGAAVLAFFAVEVVLGWAAALTPFLGGSHLDGGRFYGLPNVFIGLLVGSSLYVAQRLRTRGGVVLLVVVALVAGLPYLGANLGGGVTLFAAAGLWLAVRERDRLGAWKAVAAFVGTTVAGTAVILVGHALSPVATHVSRFEEHAVGIAGIGQKFLDRLQVGFDLIARNPAALIPVLGLPVVLFVILRPPGPIRETFARWPAWRDAVLVIVLAGIVAYLVNDSGPAAAGLAFGLGLGGTLGVSLLAGAEKMGGP